MFDKAAKVLSIAAGFSVIFGFLSGFALSNGLSQQQHMVMRQEAQEGIKLLEQKFEAQEEKVRRLESIILGI